MYADERQRDALDTVRMVTALLIFIHGAARVWHGGVPPFGAWLETQGFPMGLAFAWAVTVYELTATIAIALRRFVTLACIGHIGILTLGMFMVHAPAGWFVVGLGRNGVEYSILLIACLSAVAYAH
jgi:putative oxidoreductase